MTNKTFIEMEKAAKLIERMTYAGATDDELNRAIQYSIAIIDVAKYEAKRMLSENENNIFDLRVKYGDK